ncbi:PREDICTED: uncharacterized protein LOC109586524 [Amphimedon queenslandica]|uniref:Death domain-containing protein n=1 Tax=Amphimedon queenslandica TaxID=400682 RepID=A0AAN0JNA9_AMPQE|nr:PREDICTED: uncharacterized protein LOC109586524 [Amphimedon queenslandica]|eukprot:XP_019858280.1 PREDICTED: uncharacterized protein LOC109586524 [Amphimedon queenslandica]
MAAKTSTITESQTLDIDDLAELLDLLKRHGYSGTSYYDLGLFLGLITRTLDVISKNHSGDVSAGLRECLKAWLQQADNVKEKGVPSYYSLIQALRKLGENAVADGIDRQKHPACAIFTAQCESNECIVDVLPRLVMFLGMEKIISEMLVPTTGEGPVLLEAIKRSICFDYHNLEKFATVLMRLNAQSVTSIAHSLLKDYRKAFPDDYFTIVSKENINISLPLKLTPEFTKIRTMFTDLIDDVAQAINNSVTYENLKRYVGRNKDLRPHLAHCKNTDEIIELIGDECSLINVGLLEGIVEKYEVKEAESSIQKYKNEIETFHKEGRPLRQFLDQYLAPASPLQCETATILVRKEVKDYELRDINVLMIVAFETLAPNVRVHVIKEGNSFTITCSFLVLLSESLIATALDNIDSLIERGVKKLTIGYSTVYDHDKLFQHEEAATSKKYIMNSEMKQQLYASVYSSQGTMEQLLISRTIQLLNSEEELASVQQLKEKNEKLEAKVKVSSGMKWEVDQLRTREKENVEELKMLQEKISMQGVEILEKKDQQKQLQKSLEEKEKEMKAELQKIDGLFYSFLQEKDTELQEVIQMQLVNDTQHLQGIE